MIYANQFNKFTKLLILPTVPIVTKYCGKKDKETSVPY